MLDKIPGPLRGIISLSGYTLNTLFWCLFLFIVTLLKAVVPLKGWRRQCSRVLNVIATRWIAINNLGSRSFALAWWGGGLLLYQLVFVAIWSVI